MTKTPQQVTEEQQKQLFDEMKKLCQGKYAGAVKGAVVQILIGTILLQAENDNEATDLWNQLTKYAASVFEGHFKNKIGQSEMSSLQDPPWKNKKLS